jgi:small subunit ribosomal protein S18
MGNFDPEMEEVEESGHREGRSYGPGGSGPSRFGPRRSKVCNFCLDKMRQVPYRDSDMLRRYLTERGKIRPRRQTGTCAKHQRSLARAIKRARHLALIPFTTDSMRQE